MLCEQSPPTSVSTRRARKLQQSTELHTFLLSTREACAHMEEQRALACSDEMGDSLDRAEVCVCVCLSVFI